MRKVVKASSSSQVVGRMSSWKLTRVAVETRALVQFSSDHPTWHVISMGGPPDLSGIRLKDCIAKLTPPAGTSESDVLTLEAALLAGGARTVRRMPSPPEDRVVSASADKAPTAHRTLLQVAVDRAKRGTSVDSAALVALVELAMSKGE